MHLGVVWLLAFVVLRRLSALVHNTKPCRWQQIRLHGYSGWLSYKINYATFSPTVVSNSKAICCTFLHYSQLNVSLHNFVLIYNAPKMD